MKNRISVCIATYNGEKWIERQLTSILKQLSNEDEIIIVDDLSIDGTINKIKKIKDKRIKIFYNTVNIGFVNSFERAIRLAKNSIIFLSDQDDLWFDNKVNRVLETFKKENADLVIHNGMVVDSKNEIIKRRLYTKKLGGNIFTRNLINNHNMGCMMAFKREFSETLLPFPKIVESHDQWIGLNADLENKKIYFLDENLMLWVRHNNNFSSMKRRRIDKVILTRLKIMYLIFNIFLKKIKTY